MRRQALDQVSRDLTGPDPGDDELYRWLIESLCLQDQQYAHEVHDGVIEVVFAYEGDLARTKLLLTRQQLRHLVQSEKTRQATPTRQTSSPRMGSAFASRP